MIVQIEKYKSRFLVRCKYDEKMLKIIHSIEKRFWNKEKLEWSLPMDAYNEFVKEIQDIGLTVDILDKKPHAIVIQNNDKLELKFATFVNQFDQFKKINDAVYDRDLKKLILPNNQLTQIVKLLNDNDISYTISTQNETTTNDETTKSKTKRKSTQEEGSCTQSNKISATTTLPSAQSSSKKISS